MNNYLIPNKPGVFGFDESQSQFIPQDAVLIPSTYKVDQYPFLSLTSNGKINFDSAAYNIANHAATILNYNGAAQASLDKTAIEWGYDNILSAVSYMTSNNPQFAAEGTALSNWRDATWSQAYTIEAGTLPDSVEAFLAMLPPAPVKPVV